MNKRIVIEIDEDIYQGIKESDFAFARNAVRSFQATIADAIRKGTPLDAEIIQALEDVRAEIEARTKNYRKEQSEIIWDTADITNGIFEQTSYGQGLGLKEALEIIDFKIKEIKNESTRSEN